MLEIGGAAILERQIAELKARGVADICIVTGYEFAQLEQRFGGRVEFRYNPFFAHSNNMVSLLFARDWIADDVLVLYADLIFDPQILDVALASREDIAITVDKTAIEPGHAHVSIRGDSVVAIGRDVNGDAAHARFVGIAKFLHRGLNEFFSELDTAAKEKLIDQYYTVGLARLAARGYPIAAIDVAGRRWWEIDSAADLARARREWR